MRRRARLFVVCLVAGLGAACGAEPPSRPPAPGAVLPDLSGLAWLGGDTLVAVHDAKRGEEEGMPRVSLLRLPGAAGGLAWTPLEVAWPDPHGASHDLESLARIPGTRTFLLAESGDDTTGYRRVFAATLTGGTVAIRGAAAWPVPVANVEGAAVARLGDRMIFLFAERAPGRGQTQIAWAPFTLDPLTFGPVREATFHCPDPAGPDARPVSALEVDGRGRIYAVSTVDPGETGPFRSVVWEIGAVAPGDAGAPEVVLLPEPLRRATLDGVKVESLALREQPGAAFELFAGTDDEAYAGALRPLPGWR